MSGLPPPQPYQVPRSKDTQHLILVTLQAILVVLILLLGTLWVWLLRLVELAPFVRPVLD